MGGLLPGRAGTVLYCDHRVGDPTAARAVERCKGMQGSSSIQLRVLTGTVGGWGSVGVTKRPTVRRPLKQCPHGRLNDRWPFAQGWISHQGCPDSLIGGGEAVRAHDAHADLLLTRASTYAALTTGWKPAESGKGVPLGSASTRRTQWPPPLLEDIRWKACRVSTASAVRLGAASGNRSRLP